MIIYNKYLLILIIFVSLSFSFDSIAATNVQLGIEGCNNNNICELAEDEFMCANDCTQCNFNNICETLKGETSISCSTDCVAPVVHRSPSGGQTTFNIENTNLKVKIGINYAVISWDTSVASYGSVNFGIGDSYNTGIVNSIDISNHHEIILENLVASTKYSFFVSSGLPGYEYSKKYGIFETLPPPVIIKVPLISNFSASPTGNEIIFNWTNPENITFTGLRIVRSPFFYPTDPTDGKVIYEGSGNYVRDSNIDFNKKYYYAAFSYDKNNNYSTGVLLETMLKSPEKQKDETVQDISKKPIESTYFMTIDLKDYIFMGGDIDFGVSSNTLRVYPFNDLQILIEADKLPEGIKLIILKIFDKNDTSKVLSYSFSFDKLKKVYYLSISNINDKQIHPFSIISYDKSNTEVSRSNGFFEMKSVDVIEKYNSNFLIIIDSILNNSLLKYIIIAIFVLLGLFFLLKR